MKPEPFIRRVEVATDITVLQPMRMQEVRRGVTQAKPCAEATILVGDEELTLDEADVFAQTLTGAVAGCRRLSGAGTTGESAQ